MGEPPLGGVCCPEELPDSQSCLGLGLGQEKAAPRNRKWGQAGESRS